MEHEPATRDDQPVGQDRREFLRLAALGVVAGPLVLAQAGHAETPATVAAPGAPTSQSSQDLPLVINALGGLEDPNPPEKATDAVAADQAQFTMSAKVLGDAHASGLTAVNITLGYVSGPEEPFEATVRDVGLWDRLIRENARDLLRVETAADIRRARREGRIGIIYGLQNGAALGEKPERVDILGNLGLRVIQLTYNPRNLLGDGSLVAENHGLTPLGRRVVARLNAQRIMVDLSHSGEATCLEAARVSQQPISINHTGCRALVDLPRNKTDQELRLVAERGGFVGIFFMPFLSPSGHATAIDVVAHLDHAINVCGEDHVGIGTDGPVTAITDLEGYKVRLAEEVAERKAAGISAAGERADTLPFVVDLRGVAQFRELSRLLQQRGYRSTRIEKILGANFLRFAETVWGA
jgi:membrane dipeptidase